MTLYELFPRLTPDNHRVTSPETTDYNCIGWAANDTKHWWWPGAWWPIKIPPGEYGISVLEQAMKILGYVDTESLDMNLDPGIEKIALYGDNFMFTHASRQLQTGKWTSKLGALAVIVHDSPNDIAGSDYGEVVEIMKRPLTPLTHD